jgi:BirA family transcriptional regulator, biotin operon repressor / biotin---[acetyl-CoA-carboxylase] ligase
VNDAALPVADLPVPLRWEAETLWTALRTVLPQLTVEVHAQLPSTNTLLIDRARQLAGRHDAPVTVPDAATTARTETASGPWGRRAVDTHPCLVVAEHQSMGRGRQGRDWLAQAGRSLTFSLGLPMNPRQWGGLSLAVGVALADALDPPAPGWTPRIGLKWPNDLWLLDASAANGVGRKLAGILIETVPVGRQRMVVVGVGVNVLPPTPNLGSERPSAAPLAQLSSGLACVNELQADASAPGVLHQLALPLAQALLRFDAQGLEPFLAAYARRDLLAGRTVRVIRPASAGGAGTEMEAVAAGISASGALLVRDGGPALLDIHSGEVSVRIAPAVAPTGQAARWLQKEKV